MIQKLVALSKTADNDKLRSKNEKGSTLSGDAEKQVATASMMRASKSTLELSDLANSDE